MKSEILRRERGDLTLAGFAAAAAVVLALVFATYWLSAQQRRAAAWIGETHEVLRVIANTRGALVDIQNGHRGYTIEGREQALEPYSNGVAAVRRESARLHEMLRDTPEQKANLAQLDLLLPARLASAAQLVAARRAGGFAAAKEIVDSGWPAEQMFRLRVALQQMESEQERLLAARLAEHEKRLRLFWIAVGTIVTLLVAALALLYLQERRRRRDRQRLFESEQRFHLMTNSVVDYAIVMLDPEGGVRTWNAGAERITGHGDQEVTAGRNFSCFYPEEAAQASVPAQDLQMAAQTGHCAKEGWRLRRDGSRFWASVVISAMWNKDGTLRGFCMVLRDLTERRKADQALRAEMQERARIGEELQRLNASLEGIVVERTRELRQANADLLAAKQRLQDLSSRLINAQEQERRHIARELHDETGQSLTAIRLNLMDVVRGADPASRLPDSLQIVDRAIQQIRGMALKLRPTMLDDLGLVDALEWALEQQGKAAGWVTELDADPAYEGLPSDLETACFRIAQEAMTNAARHARATKVKLQLRVRGDELEVSVIDDGAGFDLERYRSPEERRKHFGLVSMTERASLVGGRLDIATAPGQGACVRAILPIPREQAEADVPDWAVALGPAA